MFQPLRSAVHAQGLQPDDCCFHRYDVLESMQPWMGGGEMIQDVFLDHSTYADPPSRSAYSLSVDGKLPAP